MVGALGKSDGADMGAAGVPETVWTPSVDQSYDRSVAAQIVRA